MSFFEKILDLGGKKQSAPPQEIKKEKLDFFPSTPEEEILKSREKIGKEILRGGANYSEHIKLKDDGSGIFKPKRGEKKRLRCVEGGTFYKRERAAYLVDKFLGFELVPPTIIREIEGEVGSFQQYIQDAKSGYEVDKNEIKMVEMIKMRVFDYIIWNTDRFGSNFLVKGKKLWAIDNGLSFCRESAANGFFPIGLNVLLNQYIPQEVIDKLEKFFSWDDGKKILKDLLLELLDKDEVDACFKRMEIITDLISTDLIRKSKGAIPYEAKFELAFD